MPFQKYRMFEPVVLDDRQWPGRVITKAPRWCSVDLRDGNQALIDPMNVDEKLRMFELLVEIGFAEIEVGFPAASQPDFDFVRRIIEEDRIPDNVTIQVLCQARSELITRTAESLQGAKNAIFHLYNSTSTLQRDVVFNMDRDGIKQLALDGTRLVKAAMADFDGNLTLEYSPESFTGTELDFAVEICAAVCDEWGATAEAPVIINLPATVEMSTPNIYADQIEWFQRQFPGRERIVVSQHTHNDRGTGVAATELGLLAGADRVEGTLFGNGERTGNCDLVSVGMNLFSQGVDPQLNFSEMKRIRETVVAVNKLPVHERHPYAGDLVFTAFSGSHQDAIRKGMAQVDRDRWQVPYLPIDPEDIGSSYKETVRVNSQSGKGGVGFILEEYFGVVLPRDMLVEFSGSVQLATEQLDREIKPEEILAEFERQYQVENGPYQLIDYELSSGDEETQVCWATVKVNEQEMTLKGEGSGPIAAFANALLTTLNESLRVIDYHEHAMSRGKDAEAICMLAIDDEPGRCYGVGISRNTVRASLQAMISALNRRWAKRS
ncbi:MAG: 2-isopropylmalate synthase [Pseudomonadota bacterium]